MNHYDYDWMAEELIEISELEFEEKSEDKYNIHLNQMLRLLSVSWLWQEVYEGLAEAMFRKGHVLIPLGDVFQITSLTAIKGQRKLPSEKFLEVFEDTNDLSRCDYAKIIRELYETRFNARARGAFYGHREDFAKICEVKILTPPVIHKLADDLAVLPLKRRQKTVRQGYTLIDAGDCLAVLESKVVWRVRTFTDEMVTKHLKSRK